ncbi:MAG TPA: ANTAR domain-containing protein [Gaiellales bacterium]|nr:ANTAR domain-containing protein [Gaiellales bacterium]
MADAHTNPDSRKLVNEAVAIIATRYGFQRDQAYEILRSGTNEGRSIGDVAKGIIAARNGASS